MYEPIQVPRGFFYHLPHVVIAVEVEDVGHKIEGMLVILNLRVKACQVEPVC